LSQTRLPLTHVLLANLWIVSEISIFEAGILPLFWRSEFCFRGCRWSWSFLRTLERPVTADVCRFLWRALANALPLPDMLRFAGPIPPALGRLKCLTFLRLSANKLSGKWDHRSSPIFLNPSTMLSVAFPRPPDKHQPRKEQRGLAYYCCPSTWTH